MEKVAPELGKMYRMKEGLRDIFDSQITVMKPYINSENGQKQLINTSRKVVKQ
ncbi:hypothetical protein WKK05_11795 [Nostoc sp. UHCC 0302]|uniref:hypothetical protein n=1 Tax=Nostoc sp. UHCC 0302 TaxID=3134896 RepID=UPI00311CDE3F